jgi:hypothetical protein
MKKTTPVRNIRKLKSMGFELLAEDVHELGVPVHASSLSRAKHCLMDLSPRKAHALSQVFRGQIFELMILYPERFMPLPRSGYSQRAAF